MVKKVFSFITVVAFIAVATTSIFGICLGGMFDFDYDYGTVAPYDDARAYTSCTANAHYDNDGNEFYDNTCNVKVVLWNGTQSKTGTDSGSDRSEYSTGWVTYSGVDHATKVDHTGKIKCNQDGESTTLVEVINDDL